MNSLIKLKFEIKCLKSFCLNVEEEDYTFQNRLDFKADSVPDSVSIPNIKSINRQINTDSSMTISILDLFDFNVLVHKFN